MGVDRFCNDFRARLRGHVLLFLFCCKIAGYCSESKPKCDGKQHATSYNAAGKQHATADNAADNGPATTNDRPIPNDATATNGTTVLSTTTSNATTK